MAFSLSDLVNKGLCGLCKEVSLAVLPRLYMEEVMLELRRRKIEVGRKGVDKRNLVALLQNLMTLEYSEADERGQEEISHRTMSENPLNSRSQHESGETNVKVLITSEELIDSASQEHGQESGSANQQNATPQPQTHMQTNMKDTNREGSAVEEGNISGSTNMMDTTTSTDRVPAGNTANFAALQHSTASSAKTSVHLAGDHTYTERRLSESEVRSVPVRTSSLNLAQCSQQQGSVMEVPLVTVTMCPSPSLRNRQNGGMEEMMEKKSESDDRMEDGIGGDSDDCGDEAILEDDEKAVQDSVTPANEVNCHTCICKLNFTT
uniref:Uncharacterized protein n=1 Tax=Branchiostoma floridae TaxID=7739 RepID=C3ZFQ5_BRAFL|eukprot:XP_002592652.1 hypothetical protein BRAFLDRAFT_85127 [Branchiostoma floridae]